MGVHTGDSITVAPAQTLSDVEYQRMRDAAFACIRRVGVETGGSNVQFAVDPGTGEQVVIEMNPRVSRLERAGLARPPGFPIAKIAARLAVGYTLDEIPNDITRKTPASFEPTHRLRRHQGAPLGVREAARHQRRARHADAVAWARPWPSAGRSPRACRRALRSLETGRLGLNCDPAEARLRRR